MSASFIHVYRPTTMLGRAVSRCTTCRCRRRFLVRVYGWYASKWTCGGCGYVFGEEGREWTSKKDRKENIEFVRKAWPTAMSRKAAVREIIKVT